MTDDQLKKFFAPQDQIFERLVALYPENPVFVGKMCDEVLDRTGALLGEIRSTVRKEKEIKKEKDKLIQKVLNETKSF